MDIYWIADKKQCGPATVPDVLSLVQMGELTPETRGWHAGCEQWMPLKELPALADFLKEKPEPEQPEESAELPPVPPAEAEPQAQDEPVLPEGAVRVYLPSPVQRMLARFVDMALYLALVYGVIYTRQIPFDASLLPSGPIVWVAFVVLEASLLSYLGTTPGKALMGIHVRSVGADRFTFGRSLARACLVFIGGVGMMVSILPVFMMGYSWWMLRSRGLTMWDARCRTLALQFRRTGVVRQFVAIAIIFACFNITSYCMQPWFPTMVDTIEQQSPEAGQWMRSMMQQVEEPAAGK